MAKTPYDSSLSKKKIEIKQITVDEFLKRASPLDCFFTTGESWFNRFTKVLQKSITEKDSIDVIHAGLILNKNVFENKQSKDIVSMKTNNQLKSSDELFCAHMSIPNTTLFWSVLLNLIPFLSSGFTDKDALRFDKSQYLIQHIHHMGGKNKFYWAPLKTNPYINQDSENQLEIRNKMDQFIKENKKISYENNFMDAIYLITGYFKGFKSAFGNKDNMICSELVTRIYQKLGLMHKDIDPDSVYPTELLYPWKSDSKYMQKMEPLFETIYEVVPNKQ